jgi:hypothetical protein
MLNRSTIRKYLSAIVLMFFLFNIVGYYLWFHYVKYSIQNEVRQEIREGMADKDLTLITVPLNDESGICWIKAGKEFTFRGEMFDVVKIKISNDKKYLYCINDSKEKKLISDFSKNHESDQKAKKLLSSFSYIYILQQGAFLNILVSSDHNFYIKSYNTASVVSEVNSPPPKQYLSA